MFNDFLSKNVHTLDYDMAISIVLFIVLIYKHFKAERILTTDNRGFFQNSSSD